MRSDTHEYTLLMHTHTHTRTGQATTRGWAGERKWVKSGRENELCTLNWRIDEVIGVN